MDKPPAAEPEGSRELRARYRGISMAPVCVIPWVQKKADRDAERESAPTPQRCCSPLVTGGWVVNHVAKGSGRWVGKGSKA